MNNEDIEVLMEHLKKEVQAIENLINRNKELEKYEKYYETEKLIWSRKDYIPKSEIREKIKDLKDLIFEAEMELGSASKEFMIYVYQKEILEKLLEEN